MAIETATKTLTMVQAVREAMLEEMRLDDTVCILGEDVGPRGGVFLCTEGLYAEFGPDRVIDTPLSEAGILGGALGMAMNGLRPIAEIQFIDFLFPGYDQLYSEIAKIRYRSAGMFKAPMVIRGPYGGGVRGGVYHSQSPEELFAHIPGLKVVVPSNPYDAKGLLISAIRDEDPVVFLEPKRIYRGVKNEVPEGAYTVPIGKAKVVREGSDATLISYGAMLHVALEAADRLAAEGKNVEVIDLRSLVPYDGETILTSVKKTGHAVVVVEAPKLGSFANEISAYIAEKAIEYLEGPIIRVASIDTSVPYNLEKYYLPDADRIVKATKKTLEF
ncbi:alpha-ketoacid dehydrogenase subunit beta [bacterium]|nr:MAG: alpha-ketoacid dehydrogenase subunit beta [bacterium]